MKASRLVKGDYYSGVEYWSRIYGGERLEGKGGNPTREVRGIRKDVKMR